MQAKKTRLRVVSCKMTEDRALTYNCARVPGGPDVEVFATTSTIARDEMMVMRPHFHRRNAETFICLKGRGTIMIQPVNARGKPKGRKRTIRLSDGDAVTIPPMVAHSLTMDNWSAVMVVGTPGTTARHPDWYKHE